jgi:segregation and condensation protein B
MEPFEMSGPAGLEEAGTEASGQEPPKADNAGETGEMAASEPEQTALAETDAPPEGDASLKAAVEAIIYVAEEPVAAAQIASALGQSEDRVKQLLAQLVDDYALPARGLTIREVAGGYKMTTKPEHHDSIRAFARSLKPPLKLSLPALETLAVIAYKQPITGPEVQEIRGVQGAGVLKTLLDRKLITTAGRKAVIGRPILYRTTKEFLVQFGLKDLNELPSLKEFEELKRLAFSDGENGEAAPQRDEGVTGEAALPTEPVAAAPGEAAQGPQAEDPAPGEENG